MSQSIYDIAKSNPNKWIKECDCCTDSQKLNLDYIGGILQWCTHCKRFNSPEDLCVCGHIILQRKDNKLFWGGSHGWVYNWKIHAEHFFSVSSAKDVANMLCNSVGTIAVYIANSKLYEKEQIEDKK